MSRLAAAGKGDHGDGSSPPVHAKRDGTAELDGQAERAIGSTGRARAEGGRPRARPAAGCYGSGAESWSTRVGTARVKTACY